MINTFIMNKNYSETKVNNILSIIYKDDTLMLLDMHKKLVSMEMEAFVEQTQSLQKDGDVGFCNNTSYWNS